MIWPFKKRTNFKDLKIMLHPKLLSYYSSSLKAPVGKSAGPIVTLLPSKYISQISIQGLADHLHNWYDRATTRERSNDNSNEVDMKMLKEKIHVIQVSYEICKGAHLTQECPVRKEDKSFEQIKYIGLLEKTINKYCEESIKRQAADDELIRKFIKKYRLELKGTRRYNKEPADKMDMDEGLNITIKDVEKLRQILTPTIHTLPNLELVVQPYMPRSPFPDEAKVLREEEHDYIPLQDFVEFGVELFDITGVDEKADGNSIKDVKELSGLIKIDVEFDTFIQKLLHRVSQSPKSSNETGKIRREMKSHLRYSFNLSFPYPVANLRPHVVHCYFHPHLILSEEMDTLLPSK
ncbi:hypothetical protein Tco_0359495 [Tanacetum coccineum]